MDAFTAGLLQRIKTTESDLTRAREAGDDFLADVEQITFSGAYAAKRGQRVLYVTERAVFQLIDGVMTLIEIAPGVDLQHDILDRMDFAPAISPTLASMPEGLFREVWGGMTNLAVTPDKAQ